jgi:chemotaxis protein methyltransferase CheR
MKPTDFDFIATLVRERSGLVLSADKTYLVESRLAPIARRDDDQRNLLFPRQDPVRYF